MHELNITDFPGNAFATPKALRQSALKWQLLALGAQAKAISAIAREHHINLADLEFDTLTQRAEDIVHTATVIAHDAEAMPTAEILPRIVALRTGTDSLRADVANFVRLADQRAHFRLSSLLPVLFENGGDPLKDCREQETEDEHMVVDADKLAVTAGSRCYRAESEQHGTFALQVNSICDLALEMALSAASDHTPSK